MNISRSAVASLALTLILLLSTTELHTTGSASTGGFEELILGDISEDTQSLAWGDLDGDGDLDLAVGNYNGLNRLYRNLGNGSFQEIVTNSGQPILGNYVENTTSLAWGDLDGDGDLDLAIGNLTRNRLYMNIGKGYFSEIPNALGLASDYTYSLAWGDADGDGLLDLAVGNHSQRNRLFRNLGGGVFFEISNAFGSLTDPTYSIAWGDADGDGLLDLAVGNGGQVNRLFRNLGAGAFVLVPDALGPATDNTYSLAWGDMDADGLLDLAVGNSPQVNRLFRNRGGGTFQEISAAFGPSTDLTRSLAWGDMDGDGDLDLAIGNHGSLNRLFRNQGSAFVEVPNALGASALQTTSVAWADVDGNGDLDLAVANRNVVNQLYLNRDGNSFKDIYFDGRPALSTREEPTNSLAWGDLDGDGNLDLAIANLGALNRLHLNLGGDYYVVIPNGLGNLVEPSASLAWGDLDGDGDLDLAVGNDAQPNRLYRNLGGYTFEEILDDQGQPVLGTAPGAASSLAWGDLDGDGDLDLAVATISQANRLYRNLDGETFEEILDAQQLPALGTRAERTSTIALSDLDSDGDLDLAVGNDGQLNRLYRNLGGGVFEEIVTPTHRLPALGNLLERTMTMAWGDLDGDGDPDLAVGNNLQLNRLYLNLGGGNFSEIKDSNGQPPLGSATEPTSSLAWGDLDGDGDLDLAVGNNGEPNRLYRNLGGSMFQEILNSQGQPVLGALTEATTSLAWGDLDRDGDIDLAVGNRNQVNSLYRNPRQQRINHLVDTPPTLAVGQPGDLPGAAFYAVDGYQTGQVLPVPYTLFDLEENTVGGIQAYYSIDGGGAWLPALPTTSTQVTHLAASAWPTGTQHTFNWDTYASGFFGQSDQVLLRFSLLTHPAKGAASGTYSYPNQTPGPFQWAAPVATTLPVRVRGTQVRVMQEDAGPAQGASVYRLIQGQPPGEPIHPEHIWTTDSLGYLQGRGELHPGDELVALLPVTSTHSYTLFHTSAAPTAEGLDTFVITQSGVQTLTVSADNPLLVFNLDISLEWDARTDAAYMQTLEHNLERSAELLFDWSEGQATLGKVTVYHSREHWNEADIRIFASNGLRPNASLGGITPEVFSEVVISGTQVITTTYAPGQVNMAATWNRYGETAILAEDWPRTLAHELGHYLLYLDDSYLGLTANGELVAVESCPGVMADPYRQDFPYDEFHPDRDWLPGCQDTLAHLGTLRSDWATLTRFYPFLHLPAEPMLNGPARLPLKITNVQFVELAEPVTPLPDPSFTLMLEDGSRYLPQSGVQAVLFDQPLFGREWLVDLGRPVLGEVLARGASPGDRVCVFEPKPGLVGCATVNPTNRILTLTAYTDWQPDLLVTPVTSRTIEISVSHLPAGMLLSARLYPRNSSGGVAIGLDWDGEAYNGVFSSNKPVLAGVVHVWVVEGDPKPEALTSFALGGNPIPKGSIGSNAPLRSRLAPALSADGQVILFGLKDPPEGEFYTLQAVNRLPNPPSWTTGVGLGYRLMASAGAELEGASIQISYLGTDVPPGEENWLRVYFWDEERWQILPTTLDTIRNSASAPVQGVGLYALMSAIEVPLHAGWNNFAFPVQTVRPVKESLASIQNDYSMVYGYSPLDPTDPWSVYGTDAPDWVNDLEFFHFGQGYWISATHDTTLYLKGSDGSTPGAQLNAGFPFPPATYYGEVQPSAFFTPTAGLAVTAWIGDRMCGQGQTLAVDGQINYVVDVLAIVQQAGCGFPGQEVVLKIGEKAMKPAITWSNARLWHIPLAAATPVQADFAASASTGTAPLEVSFSNLSSGDYTACAWDFGDGKTGQDCTPTTHLYALSGVYTVTLTVSGLGGEDSAETVLTVFEPAAPVRADFSASQTLGVAPLVVTFMNLSDGDYAACSWDFGDGQTTTACNPPAHTYLTAGVFTATLTVSGPGGIDSAMRLITVQDPAPVPHRLYLPLIRQPGQGQQSGPEQPHDTAHSFQESVDLEVKLPQPQVTESRFRGQIAPMISSWAHLCLYASSGLDLFE